MQPFTLSRIFEKQNVIDGFHSMIWTERYYGDSDVELVVPDTPAWRTKLPEGIFLGVDGSDEIMIIETRSFEEGKMKVQGISLLSWLNNRFIRTSANHADRYWYIAEEGTIGFLLSHIVSAMCINPVPYMTGVANPTRFIVPTLFIKSIDDTGPPIKVAVPFGPVYDALRELAVTDEIGMKIVLQTYENDPSQIGFVDYRGLDRTSDQEVNDVVRFSPQLDSFTDVKELESIAETKTVVVTFAPGAPEGLAGLPGEASLSDGVYAGFDLRAKMIFAEDLTTDQIESSTSTLTEILNARAKDELIASGFVRAVDGTVVPLGPVKFGVDYGLGDLVEVEGKSGAIQKARVTEHIRSQDPTGEKSYPTLQTLAGAVSTQGPNNDDFVDAIDIPCPGGTIAGTNRYATTEAGEVVVRSGETVWYKHTATQDGAVYLDVRGTGVNPLPGYIWISVFKAAGGALSAATIDDIVFHNPSPYWGFSDYNPVSFDVIEGYTYYIAIDSDGSADAQGGTGDFELTWECLPLSPVPGYGFRDNGVENITTLVNRDIVWDSVRGRVIGMPGLDGITWEYYSGAWHAVTTATTPPNSTNVCAAVYDATNECVLMMLCRYYPVGAVPGDQVYLWKYDGVDWEDITTGDEPQFMEAQAVHVPDMETCFFVGVILIDGEPEVLDPGLRHYQTWEVWGTTDWWRDNTYPEDPPGEISQHCIAYDSVRKTIVLNAVNNYGIDGNSPKYEFRGSTWEFAIEGSYQWERIAGDNPFEYYTQRMTYDSTNNKVILVQANSSYGPRLRNLIYLWNPSIAKWEFATFTAGGGFDQCLCDYPPGGGVMLVGSFGSATYGYGTDPRTFVGKIYA